MMPTTTNLTSLVLSSNPTIRVMTKSTTNPTMITGLCCNTNHQMRQANHTKTNRNKVVELSAGKPSSKSSCTAVTWFWIVLFLQFCCNRTPMESVMSSHTCDIPLRLAIPMTSTTTTSHCDRGSSQSPAILSCSLL